MRAPARGPAREWGRPAFCSRRSARFRAPEALPMPPPDRYKRRRHKGTAMDVSPFDKARILSEALPHMQRYDEATIVVKYGGHAMGEEQLARDFARDIVLLEQLAINPVVVHGG